MPRRDNETTIPVIVLTGYLGASKTSILNLLLTRPGTRVGVIVNDLGKTNVDTGLVTGQVDAAESIAGGCVSAVWQTSAAWMSCWNSRHNPSYVSTRSSSRPAAPQTRSAWTGSCATARPRGCPKPASSTW